MSQLIEAQPGVLSFEPSWPADSRWILNLLWSAGPAPRSLEGLSGICATTDTGPVGWQETLLAMDGKVGELGRVTENSEMQDEPFREKGESLDQPVTGGLAEGSDRETECGGVAGRGEESRKPIAMKSVQTAHPGLGRDGLYICQFS